MAKWQNDLMLDAALDYIKNNTTEMYYCVGQPADRAAAISTAVASATGLSSANFDAHSDGTVSGRKFTFQAQNGLTASGSGDADHVALCSGTILLFVTTVPVQTITAGNTVNLAAWSDEVRDVA